MKSRVLPHHTTLFSTSGFIASSALKDRPQSLQTKRFAPFLKAKPLHKGQCNKVLYLITLFIFINDRKQSRQNHCTPFDFMCWPPHSGHGGRGDSRKSSSVATIKLRLLPVEFPLSRSVCAIRYPHRCKRRKQVSQYQLCRSTLWIRILTQNPEGMAY